MADEQATPKVDMRYADLLSETHATGRDLPTWPKWDETYDLTVPARTLASILAEVGAPRVDFLSLDVQGFEPAVLAGLDLPRFMPTFMLLELDDGDARRRVEEVIGSRYSLEAWLTHHDALYQCG